MLFVYFKLKCIFSFFEKYSMKRLRKEKERNNVERIFDSCESEKLEHRIDFFSIK